MGNQQLIITIDNIGNQQQLIIGNLYTYMDNQQCHTYVMLGSELKLRKLPICIHWF